MKTSKKIFALCALAALFFASCSNMIEQLEAASTPLPVKESSVSVPGCVISVVVNGTLPEDCEPKAKYKLPDGTEIELNGRVVKNDDGTTTLVFDMNPVPADLPEGELPVTVSVPGYDPAIVKVDYVPPKPLHIKGQPQMENPGTKITVVVEDDIPETPKPKLKYTITKDDGSTQEVEVEGTVKDNGDGTKTIIYDLAPIPTELKGGSLPVTFEVPGCLPTKSGVNYIPDLEILGIKVGDTTGEDSVDIYNSEAEGLPEPEILTNYHDNIDIETTYEDKDGNPVTWDQVKEFLGDYHNDGEYVVVKYNAKPKPDKSPSTAKDGEAKIYCRKDLPIGSAKATPETMTEAGQEAEAKAYTLSGAVYNGPVDWQWHKAKVVGGTDEEIDGATSTKFTPDQSYIGYFIWAKATQLATGTVVDTNKIEVKAKAVLDYEILENYSLAMTSADQGQNVFEFTAVTNIPDATLTWLVDGTQKQSGAAKEFTLNLHDYPLGWHNVEVRTAKDATPYSARKSVKRKIEQSAPVVAPSQIVEVSELDAHDGKITGLEDTMEWSDDGGLTYKPVQGGEISGLPEGTVKIRRASDDDKAASGPTTVNVPTKTYTVTAPGVVTGGSVTASKTTVKAGESVTLTTIALDGYELDTIGAKDADDNIVSLSPGEQANQKKFTMPKSDVTVTGSFKKLKYSVTVTDPDNGDVLCSATGPVEWGTEITLTIAPAQDYVLDTIGATSGGSAVPLTGDDSQKTFTMPKGDVTVTASFKKQSYALTLSPGEHGSLSADPSGNVQWGTSVTITIEPDDDYKLDAIAATCGGSPVTLTGAGDTRTFTMPKGDVTVTASFKKQSYSVTVNDSEHGEVTSSATGPVEWGTEVTLTIAPAQDYVLDTISATSGENPVTLTGDGDTRTFTMPKGDVTVTATFKENQAAPQPEPGQTGAEDYTYDTSNFLNTKFYYVKDVQWDPGNPNGTVSPSGNAYSGDGETPDEWWTSGSYTTLAKNSQTTTAGPFFGNTDNEKEIPTYTLTLYTKKDGGGYEQHVLGTSVIILGLDKNNGFMAQNGGWGTFFYTQKGWADSNEGTSNLSVNYTGCIYPTYDEIMSFINGN